MGGGDKEKKGDRHYRRHRAPRAHAPLLCAVASSVVPLPLPHVEATPDGARDHPALAVHAARPRHF